MICLLVLIAGAVVLSINRRHHSRTPHERTLTVETKGQDPCSDNSASMIDYMSLPLPIRINESSSIFTGVITSISPTLWNQDSGEYWEDTSQDGTTRYVALPYFTLGISSTTPLFGKIPVINRSFVTILGKSPSECNQVLASSLKIGNKVIVFTRMTELAWRYEQKKQILGLIADPTQSILIQGNDGLFHETYQSDAPEATGISLEHLQQQIAEIH